MGYDKHIIDNLYNSYEVYRERSLVNRFVKHSDVVYLINNLKDKNLFSVYKLGESVEGRDIALLSLGRGQHKVFMWSQMHGDESTATRAIFDVLNFLSANDQFNPFREFILKNVSLSIIPMLNPDGAEKYKRQNSIGIDLNRDALRLQSPESKILLNAFNAIQPDYSFNLHDQHSRYNVKGSYKTAAISFLAPPCNEQKSIPRNRLKAIKLIGYLTGLLKRFIPGHVSKYSDDYEPRAFGDMFQKSGSATILIESGFWDDDTEREFIRKLNFIILLSALNAIASRITGNVARQIYDNIPMNEEKLYDLILRNLKYECNENEYLVDIGINCEEHPDENGKIFITGTIEDIGDLSTFYGKKEYDFSGHFILPGIISSIPDFYTVRGKIERIFELYEQGITTIKSPANDLEPGFTDIPLNICSPDIIQSTNIQKGSLANLRITRNGITEFIVLNGSLINIRDRTGILPNGVIIK